MTASWRTMQSVLVSSYETVTHMLQEPRLVPTPHLLLTYTHPDSQILLRLVGVKGGWGTASGRECDRN